MPDDTDFILSVLDQCSRNFTFPMLDNGYVYLAQEGRGTRSPRNSTNPGP
jgi:hypothetical protein